MSNLIRGKALFWGTFDPTGIVTAVTDSVLRRHFHGSAQPRLVRAVKPADLVGDSDSLGLMIWNIDSFQDLRLTCGALALARSAPEPPVCIAFLAYQFLDGYSILVEAGAQIVVSELTSLEYVLNHVVPCVRLSSHGYHPLTSGLLSRLPWPELDSEETAG